VLAVEVREQTFSALAQVLQLMAEEVVEQQPETLELTIRAEAEVEVKQAHLATAALALSSSECLAI